MHVSDREGKTSQPSSAQSTKRTRCTTPFLCLALDPRLQEILTPHFPPVFQQGKKEGGEKQGNKVCDSQVKVRGCHTRRERERREREKVLLAVALQEAGEYERKGENKDCYSYTAVSSGSLPEPDYQSTGEKPKNQATRPTRISNHRRLLTFM